MSVKKENIDKSKTEVNDRAQDPASLNDDSDLKAESADTDGEIVNGNGNGNNGENDIDKDLQLIQDQQKRIQELEEELQRVKDTHLRKAAELDNMRKRLNRDRELVYQGARESAILEFLPVNDDLLRTLDAMKNANADESYIEGVQLVAAKFNDILSRHDVKRIDETGVPFDVDLHDAMLRQKPEDDSVESGIVLQVLENGYQMGDKTVRHAKVIVSE